MSKKWNIERVIAQAYGEVFEQRKNLRKAIQDMKQERVFEAVFEAAGAQAQEPQASGECDCPICTTVRAMKKAQASATLDRAAAQQGQAKAKAEAQPQAGVNVSITATTANVNRGDAKTTVHPWDVEVAAEPGNPLGSSARTVIKDQDDVIANLSAEITRLTNWVTDLEQKAQVLQSRNPAPVSILAEQMTVFQRDVASEVIRLWGSDKLHHKRERTQRFIEEALELAQSNGLTFGEVADIAYWVFNREPGRLPREIGGTLVTLAALAELAWLRGKTPEEMRARHDDKPASIRTV